MYEFAFMFFVGIAIATLAMTLGMGGALMFSPFFIIVFPLIGLPPLSPADAFGAALLIEVFGFASGLVGYGRRKLIDYKTASVLIVVSIPSAIIGTIVKRKFLDPSILNAIFGAVLLILAIYVYRNTQKERQGPPIPSSNSPRRYLTDNENNIYEYQVCNQFQGRLLAGLGGASVGLISLGVGETTVTTLRVRCGVPMRIATGTSVFVVAVTVLSAALTDIALIGFESVPWSLVLFTIPGVLIGGQIGPNLATKLSSETGEKILIVVFLFFGILMLFKGLAFI